MAQMVAIARALAIQSKLVVMDEPTSSLDNQEVKILFQVIRRLKSQGVSIIFISHRLNEVYEICDRVTILKDGVYRIIIITATASQSARWKILPIAS